MKFIYADSLDFVDPDYDFIQDRSRDGRKAYWDDQFTHEYLGYAPYDGILVSRAIVGDHRFPGKYTETQSMRFRRVGAAEFLRFRDGMLFGDCGAFSYHQCEIPPYTTEEIVGFYEDGGFTHGCSVDHIIFDYDPKYDDGKSVGAENIRRQEITLANAREFLHETHQLTQRGFTPMGVVQGWSPASMAGAARQLEAMGYDYLAIGGMVPLNVSSIKACLQAIRDAIRPTTRIHVLGFAKADNIHEFRGLGITSFDTTSPLLRAFKDGKSNYYLPAKDGGLDYYTAIRIPQALENNQLSRMVKTGRLDQERLQLLERRALDLLRAYDREQASLDDVLEAVLLYTRPLLTAGKDSTASERKLADVSLLYRRTLADRPWRSCDCPVCRRLGIEVIIFRSSNRNKRRGMHNIDVFARHLRTVLSASEAA